MYRLMVVEDETIIRRGIVKGIQWEELGFHVIAEAANGKTALKHLDRAQLSEEIPDVMLVDIQMPVMNGLSLMKELQRFYPFIRIVVLSGYSDFDYARQAMNFGAMGYLLKPTQKAEISKTFSRIKKALDEERITNLTLSAPKTKVDPVVEKLLQYIQSHYCEHITLESAAGVFYMNPSYFSTFFKQKTGESFKHCVTRFRMEKAKALLLETDLKTYDIAGLVGYDDFRYFCRLFKTVTGKTVMAFRKEGLANEEK